MIINALDFESPQLAIDAAVDGDTVYFPSSGVYVPSSVSGTLGFVIDKSITILGDGPGGLGLYPHATPGTLFQPSGNNARVFTLVAPVRSVHFRGIQLLGLNNPGAGTDYGIVAELSEPGDGEIADIGIDNVIVRNFAGDGLRFIGFNTVTDRIARLTIANSRVEGCGSVGVRMTNVVGAVLRNVAMKDNKRGGCVATTSTIGCYACEFDGNGLSASGPTDANALLDNCAMGRIDGCRFINVQKSGAKRALTVNKGSAVVSASEFTATSAPGTQGVLLTGNGGGPFAVLSHRFENIATLVKADAGVQNVVLLAQYDVSGTGSFSLAAGACVFGVPHIARASANIMSAMAVPWSPLEPNAQQARPGMLFYNTTLQALRFRTGSGWKTVGTGPPTP